MKITIIILVVCFTLSCGSDKNLLVPSVTQQSLSQARQGEQSPYTYEQIGQFAYKHLKYYVGTVDFTSYLPKEEKDRFVAIFDSLKRENKFDYETTFDLALSNRKITESHHKIIKQHIKDLMAYVGSGAKSNDVQTWCLAREQDIINSPELNYSDKNAILNHQALLRYFLKYWTEDILSNSESTKGARSGGSDPCGTALCQLNIISTYAGAGSFAGLVGAIGGVVLGTVYILSNPDACPGCPTNNTCQQINSVSVNDDDCYNQSNGIHFKVYGYGNQQPEDLEWQFFINSTDPGVAITRLASLSNEPFGEMTLSGASLNGATQVAVRVVSICDGTRKESRGYGWYVLSELGKPRFIITGPSQGQIGTNSYYNIYGVRYVPVSWYASPTYATILQNNQYGAQFIVQWHQPPGTTSVSATASTSCGSLTQSIGVQVY